jgi:3-phenylpropionate/cinnamic acid dioxygenase small subunit
MLDIVADIDDRLQRQVERFLYTEAELLDSWQLAAWLDLVAKDIQYRMPVRNTRTDKQAGEIYSSRSFHMLEDYASLEARVARLSGTAAWSEYPNSRARRHISNVRTMRTGDDIGAKSYILFYWARDELQTFISGERHDVLRIADGRLKLANRTVYVDHTVLPIPNLSMVL